MDQSRLSSIFPDLQILLNTASQPRRVGAAWLVAHWAARRIGLANAAIAACRLGGPTADLAALVVELDNHYFKLQERFENGEASEAEVVSAFAQARAASEVEFAARGEADEAVYEAASSLDDVAENDVAELRSVLVSALRDIL